MSERTKATAKTTESKTENSASQKKKLNFSPSIDSPTDQILFLQRTVGNHAVERLLKSSVIQAKLTIGQPGDVYEQEADRVAEQVIRMPDLSQAQRKGVSEYNKFPSIQRVCTECEEELQRQPMEEEEELLQTKEDSGITPDINSTTESQINSVRGGGQPLPESIRAFFEPRFGQDFSQVRVHTDSQASGSANAVNALAYTVGTDIVFGAGRYTPGTESGKKLIAHELTHVVQQQNRGTPSLQQLTEVEKAENLKSPKYSGNPRLEKAFDNDPSLGIGESGEAVRLVQEDLVADGFAMPRSTKPTGEMDGGFGEETFTVIKEFQVKHGLRVDGVVGRETMGKLDELASTTPCVFPVGVFNGPGHQPLDDDTHAGMVIDTTVLPSTGRPADIQGVLASEQVSQSFDHTGSLAGVPPTVAATTGFLPALSFNADTHGLRKEFVIDRAINHGGNGSFSVHQLDIFTHPFCGVTAPRVIPESGHKIDMIITRGAGGSVELTVRKSAEDCTVNGFTSRAGPSFTHSDTVLVQPAAVVSQCPLDPTAFEVTREQLFANPKFDFDFSGGERPSLSTRAPSAPFFWNVAVKTRQPLQSCFEIGFLQTLRSAFQAAVYSSQTGGQEQLCLVIVPTPIRDAKPGAREPWYESPSRLGVDCFPGIVLPPGISADLDETSVTMDDNPFSRWCIFLGSEAENTASDCGLSDATFRLNTLVEALAFDAWLVLRPLDNSDVNCFTFLRHASWFKSVEIVVAPSGTLGFLKRDLGVTLLEHGDGIGETSPEFGLQTAKEASERVCVQSSP